MPIQDHEGYDRLRAIQDQKGPKRPQKSITGRKKKHERPQKTTKGHVRPQPKPPRPMYTAQRALQGRKGTNKVLKDHTRP